MRNVLKYPGSKWNIASQIVNLIPEHHSYVEPYFGSGAVLFNKPVSSIETVNDLDYDVVNLFRCIREDPEKLARFVAATPYSRSEYDDTYKIDIFEIMAPNEPYHKALRFLIRCWQGYGFRTNGYKVGWKNDVQGRERSYALLNWYHLPERIMEVAERLRLVQIENRPALEVIKRFNYKNVFMYIDPPYVLGSRVGGQKQYKHEMTDNDHIGLLEILLQSNAKIMISGYESDLYNDYLKGWNKMYFSSCAEQGKPRTEVIWMNYEVEQQLSLFS